MCIIAVHLFVGLVLHKRPKRKYEIVYHCVVWGMASVFMVLPGTTRFVQGLYSFNIFRDYGPAGVWLNLIIELVVNLFLKVLD